MILRTLLSFLAFALPATAFAGKAELVRRYADTVSMSYQQALTGAEELQVAINAFVASPSPEGLQKTREAWVNARKLYLPTEAFRFYGGPIDDQDGPEPFLNAWPLDEAYIDSVVGNPAAGIINQTVDYPILSKSLLRELNEKEGEANISTGYHAIEFLLWGQDFNFAGPGDRQFTDYVSAPNAERRRQYLSLLGEILVEDLSGLVKEWDLSVAASYGSQFVSSENLEKSVESIFRGLHSLSGEELSQERLYVAYDTRLQEDEHSCFSDTTHLDLQLSFEGLDRVLALIDQELLTTSHSQISQELLSQRKSLQKMLLQFPTPFDQAIQSEADRPKILAIVRALEALAEEIQEIAAVVGVKGI